MLHTNGDVAALEILLGTGELSGAQAALGRAALQRLKTPVCNLIRGSLKRSKSYHSELENMTYEQLLKLNTKAARQMRKLIEETKRLMEKNK